MDKKELVERIKAVLCVLNTEEKRYEMAWLSLADDLTSRERYVLHVKAEHLIPSCYDGLRFLIETLRDKLAPSLLTVIARIVVYNSNEDVHCWSEDLVLFEDAAVC